MRISIATPKAVRYACMNFHYAKAVPTCQYGFNIFNDKDEWCGVIVFGGGATPTLVKHFGMCSGEVLELERVALNGKQEQTSKAVAMALNYLHKVNPLVKLVVSFADQRQKHVGTIYQATNWIYLGVSDAKTYEYLLDGKWTHKRSINARSDRDMLKETLPKRETSLKFRYIFVFDKRLRKKYLQKAQPYPKEIT